MSFNYYENFDGSDGMELGNQGGVDLGTQGGVYDLGIYQEEEKDKAGITIIYNYYFRLFASFPKILRILFNLHSTLTIPTYQTVGLTNSGIRKKIVFFCDKDLYGTNFILGFDQQQEGVHPSVPKVQQQKGVHHPAPKEAQHTSVPKAG